MFTLDHTMAVNTEAPRLNRAQIWQGLVLKAENPVPFLDAMSACTVIDRGENWLLRDFTLRGEDMQARVTFGPRERGTFERTTSSAMGTILNEILELDDGDWARLGAQLQATPVPAAATATPVKQNDDLWQNAQDLLRKAGQLSGLELLDQLEGLAGDAASGKRLLVRLRHSSKVKVASGADTPLYSWVGD